MAHGLSVWDWMLLQVPAEQSNGALVSSEVWIYYRLPLLCALLAMVVLAVLAWRLSRSNRMLQTAHAAAQSSEAHFRSLLETSAAGIYVIQGTRFVVVNSALTQMTGYSAAELLGMQQLELVHPTQREEVRQRVLARQAGVDLSAHYDVRLLTKSGVTRWAEVHAGVIQYHGKVSVVGTIFDVTERRNFEVALRHTRDYLDNLLNCANAPIIVWNADYRITLFNGAFERLTGLSVATVMGQSIEILFPAEIRERSMDFIRASGAAHWDNVELAIRGADQSTRTLLWNSSSLLGDDETATSTIAQGVDISDRKRAEASLRRSEALLQAMGRLANVGGWELDLSNNEVYWTEQVWRIHELQNTGQVGLARGINFYHPDDRDALARDVQLAIAHGIGYDRQYRLITAQKNLRWTRSICEPVLGKV